jgi:hypothetical protein
MKQMLQSPKRFESYMMLAASAAGLFVTLAAAIFLSIVCEGWYEARQQKRRPLLLRFKGGSHLFSEELTPPCIVSNAVKEGI